MQACDGEVVEAFPPTMEMTGIMESTIAPEHDGTEEPLSQPSFFPSKPDQREGDGEAPPPHGRFMAMVLGEPHHEA